MECAHPRYWAKTECTHPRHCEMTCRRDWEMTCPHLPVNIHAGYHVKDHASEHQGYSGSLLEVAVWCMGEYGEMLVNNVGMLEAEEPVMIVSTWKSNWSPCSPPDGMVQEVKGAVQDTPPDGLVQRVEGAFQDTSC